MRLSKFICVLCLTVGLFVPCSAFAASGSAVISNWRSADHSAQHRWAKNLTFVSNITNETVSVTLTYYDQDGNILSDDGNASAGTITAHGPVINYNDNVGGATATFDLAPNTSARIEIFIGPTNNFGYGRIAWTQNSDNLVALVAFIQQEFRWWNSTTLNGPGHYSVMINGGQPF